MMRPLFWLVGLVEQFVIWLGSLVDRRDRLEPFEAYMDELERMD